MATLVLEYSRVLDSNQILDEWERRKKKYEDRDSWYDMLLSYYRGGNNSTGGLPILHMNAQGRPLLRPIGESITQRRVYSSQRLKPIVDDYSALMGRMPSSRVEPPDTSPQGEEKANLLTKFLYSTYELSRMDYQQAQSGHFLSLFGDSVYTLKPDEDLKRVTWEVVSPRLCWPSFYHGYKRFEVYDLLTTEVWSPEDLWRQLHIESDNDREENNTVVTYISPYQRTIVAGLKHPVVAAHAEWNLDFCPAVWVFNIVTGHMGMSDIAASLGQQDFLDFALNVWADGIVHMTYPIIGVKNPENIGQDAIVIGPGAPPVALQQDGDIIVRSTQGDPRALEQIIAQTLEDIHTSTGTSGLRQTGHTKESQATGRAVQNLQGPQSTRIEFKQQVLGAAIEAANSMTLAMQEKAPLLKDFQGPVFGSFQGQSFRIEFNASADINGWYRNKVTWQSLVGMNLQQKTAVAYEGMVAKLWDDIRAREIIGEEDPIGMRQRIENQLMSEAKLQQQIQQPPEQQQGGQPGGAQGGGMQGPPQPGQYPGGAQVFRPPPPAGAQSQGGQAPVGGTDALKPALQKIADTLKGSVWLSGGMILVSDHRDYSKIKQLLAEVGMPLRVKQMSEAQMTADAQRLV